MKNMLKHLAGLMLALLFSCTGGKTIEITVTNPSGVARPAEVVVVDYKALQKAFSGLRLEPNIQIYNVNHRSDRALTLIHSRYNRKPLGDTTQEMLRHLHRLLGFDVRLMSMHDNGRMELMAECKLADD